MAGKLGFHPQTVPAICLFSSFASHTAIAAHAHFLQTCLAKKMRQRREPKANVGAKRCGIRTATFIRFCLHCYITLTFYFSELIKITIYYYSQKILTNILIQHIIKIEYPPRNICSTKQTALQNSKLVYNPTSADILVNNTLTTIKSDAEEQKKSVEIFLNIMETEFPNRFYWTKRKASIDSQKFNLDEMKSQSH